MHDCLLELSWVSQQILVPEHLRQISGMLNEIINVKFLQASDDHVSEDKLANVYVHHQILQKRVTVVAEPDNNFLVFLCIHVDRIILHFILPLLIDDLCNLKAKLSDILKYAQTARGLSHKHLDSSS